MHLAFHPQGPFFVASGSRLLAYVVGLLGYIGLLWGNLGPCHIQSLILLRTGRPR